MLLILYINVQKCSFSRISFKTYFARKITSINKRQRNISRMSTGDTMKYSIISIMMKKKANYQSETKNTIPQVYNC